MPYINCAGERVTWKEVIPCPECGKPADDWQEGDWQHVPEYRVSVKEYSPACFTCGIQWSFQEERPIV